MNTALTLRYPAIGKCNPKNIESFNVNIDMLLEIANPNSGALLFSYTSRIQEKIRLVDDSLSIESNYSIDTNKHIYNPDKLTQNDFILYDFYHQGMT